jgi:YbgC/YbaW family acyl-CoA thioester hydrolase
MPRKQRTIALKRRVTWSDADPAGIMNSARAFDYSVEVIEEFYRRVLGWGFGELIEKHGMGVPMVHVEADYFAPLPQGKTVTLTAVLEKLGHSSVAWRVEARRADRKIAFRVRAVTSFIRNDGFRSAAIPMAWRKKLSRYLPT